MGKNQQQKQQQQQQQQQQQLLPVKNVYDCNISISQTNITGHNLLQFATASHLKCNSRKMEYYLLQQQQIIDSNSNSP